MIYCIGESLYDIVFRNNRPDFAVAGGGMLNCAVTLAHAGAAVQLITELGHDRIGSLILNFLHDSGVLTDYLRVSPNATTLALAFLDEHGAADYQFYTSHDEMAPAFTVPDFKKGDVMVFGSFYSASRRNRPNIVKLALAARNAGAIVLYDPNFRKSHAGKLNEVYDYIVENFSMADIVRGSDEDFQQIAGTSDTNEVFRLVNAAGSNTLLLTRNKAGADLMNHEFSAHYDTPPVDVVSTIGAGDAFNAGIAMEISTAGALPGNRSEWDKVVARALQFSSEVCTRKENYIARRNH